MQHQSESKKNSIKNTISDTTVDSTQSVEYLVKNYVRQIHVLSLFHRRLFTKPKLPNPLVPHYLLSGHPMNTFPQDWDGVLPRNFYQPIEYKSTLPTIMTNARNNGMADPLLEHLRIKHTWTRNVLGKAIAAECNSKEIPLKQENAKLLYCAKSVVELAVALEEDPLPLFDSDYNWHYAGNGNLQVLSVGNEDCVLHSEFNRLYLSKLSRRRKRVKHKFIFSYDCGEGNNILETICNTQYIALRFMFKVLLLRLIERDGTINVKKIKEIEFPVIVTSISFDEDQRNILYIARLDNTATILNLDVLKGRTLEFEKTKSLVNNWGTVMGIDLSTYCHVGRETISIFDKRTNSVVHKWDDTVNSYDYCDKFNVVKKCGDLPFMYIGTRHQLFLADMRLKTRFVQRWTPMFYCEPSYLSYIKMEDGKDLVCLCSQWPDDTCVVVNNSQVIRRKGYSRHMTMPLQLPGVEEVLLRARAQRRCLDPYNPVSQRLHSALTGVSLAEAGDQVLVMTQNAMGDIFCNTLYHETEESEVEDHSVEKLHEWCKTLKDLSKTIKVTDVLNISDFWTSLKRIPPEYKLGCEKVWSSNAHGYSEREVSEICSKNEIDVGLLSAWNLQETSEAVLPLDLELSDCE